MKIVLIILLTNYIVCLRHYDKIRGPVVGILTVPTSKSNLTFSSSSFSMIPGSYVKWLEQAGIRIIPIRYDLPKDYIDKLMRLVNGVLITGGAADLFQNKSTFCKYSKILNEQTICPSPYMETVKFIFDNAQKMAQEGNPLPVWGTCLGYEAMILALSNYTLQRSQISSENHSLNLQLNPTYRKLFLTYLGEDLIKAVNEQPISYFNHKYAFLPDQLRNSCLKEDIQILSTVKLENNQIIVAMIKHRKFPFIGVQFHPEKIQYEHKDTIKTNVTFESLEISHKLSMLFFDLVSKNNNEISDERQLESLLIYNYPLYKSSGVFEQIYVFPKFFDLSYKKDKLIQFNYSYIQNIILLSHVHNLQVLEIKNLKFLELQMVLFYFYTCIIYNKMTQNLILQYLLLLKLIINQISMNYFFNLFFQMVLQVIQYLLYFILIILINLILFNFYLQQFIIFLFQFIIHF